MPCNSQPRIDLRCLVVTVLISIVFMYYVLIAQYDASLFNPMNISHDLQRFTNLAPIKRRLRPKPIVPLSIANRVNTSYVIVGYCCQHDGIYEPCKPQKFVKQLAEGTFLPINKRIIYQQCTKKGTAPKFMIDPYEPEPPALPSNVTRLNQLWYLPDILLCQGYFYDDAIIGHRAHLSQAERLEINTEQQMKLYHHLDVPYDIDNYGTALDVNNIIYADNLKYSIRLSRSDSKLWHHFNRSFLTTYNTEFWGGGKCSRYDIVFESVFDRTLHGCVTVYVPPAFYFESERMYNETTQLILPSDITPTESSGNAFTAKQQGYIDSILDFKDAAKFALFLVRDCYKPKYHIDAALRVIFFDTLSEEYKPATSLGGCRRNWDIYKALGWSYCPKNSFNGHYINNLKYNCSGYGWTDGVVQMARPYKFFITFENSKIKGYSTEKIFNALYANAVPIYFGDPMITQYLNKNKFVHCNTISDAKIREMRRIDKHLDVPTIIEKVKPIVIEDIRKCIQKVKKIDQNDTLYHRMLLEPVFVNNTFENTVMDPNVIGDKLRYALKLHDSYLVDDVDFTHGY